MAMTGTTAKEVRPVPQGQRVRLAQPVEQALLVHQAILVRPVLLAETV